MSNVIEFAVRAMDDFSATMTKFHRSMSDAEKIMSTLGVTAAAYTALRMAQASLDNAEAMGDAAEKANMAAEEFSALAWAAKMSNAEQGNLTVGLKMLGKAISEGEAAVTPAGEALRNLGVSAQDANGRVRPALDVLLDISDKFQNAAQDANKTRVAMDLFGARAGPGLVPLLNKGSEAIREMMGDAQKLGIVVSSDFAASADQLKDNLATLSAVVQGSVNVAMSQLSPVLEQLTGQAIELATSGDNVQEAGQVIATALRLVMTAALGTIGTVKALGDALGGVIAASVMLASGNMREALDTLKMTTLDVGGTISATFDQVKNVWDENAQSAAANSAKQISAAMQMKDSLASLAKEEEEAIKREIEHSNKMQGIVADMQLAYTTYGMNADQLKIYTLAVQGADEALIAEAVNLAAANAQQEEHSATLKRGEEILLSLQTPLELHNQKLQEINASREQLLAEGKFDAALEAEEARWQRAQAAVEWYGVSVASVSKGIGDAMAATVVDGVSLAKGLENVAKTVLKTVISTLVQMGAQRLILAMLDRTATTTGASQKLAAGLSEVYVNSFASAAAIPMVGWAMAPQVALANTAIATAGASASMAAGAGLGASVAGAAHGGLDFVPAESTFLLDKGERVLSPRQNADLTAFLEEGGAGGEKVTIQNLTIHILENATNVDAFARMDKAQLRNTLGQPIIDALNEMFRAGTVPNFATQGGR